MSEVQLVSHPASESEVEAARQAWDLFCVSIERNLSSQQTYLTWFKPIVPLGFADGTLSVEVPSKFYYDWIEGHYSTLIEKALQDTFGNDICLKYSIASPVEKKDKSLPNTQIVPEMTVPKPETGGDNGGSAKRKANLNSRYQFNNFIEGPTNRFALAACLDVGQSPGKTNRNPLLIYGGVGLGKTHLLQAIGHEALKNYPNIRILYTDSETFTKEFVEAIKNKRAMAFSARCKEVDIFLFDDVQFLMGRDGTQMEFFHIFNALHQDGKQIVLSSDQSPRDIGLQERLASRIRSGLVCDIGPPDFDTRVAIVESFAEEDGVELPEDVSFLIAEHFSQNVRDLQGAVIRILAHSSLNGSGITISHARSVLNDLFGSFHTRVSIDMVQYSVSDYFDIPVDLMLSKTRTQPTARVRMIAMSLCLRLCGLSLKQVGRHFGNRDHTTVLHAKKEVNKWVKSDADFASFYDNIINRILAKAA
ncbi:MAG: chromosomal replication initiator protein DnaA [Candidatus Electryonea clarkiae]|nr:chromosomal replication initiator protein DnaA [Candidatus Electryonea clarkiae]MDP8288969.1 chromosomal replication initiator protein DnaA [Candidatus Electryonea clarkiae]